MRNRKGLSVIEYVGKDDSEHTIAKLYDTIIYIKEENYIKLNTDGFRTKHTKNCINDLLPDGYRLYQKQKDWFIDTPTETIEFKDDIKLEGAF